VLVGAGFPKKYPVGDPDAYPTQDALPELIAELRGRLAIRQPALASADVIEATLPPPE